MMRSIFFWVFMLLGCAGLLGYAVFGVRVKNEQLLIMMMLLAFMLTRPPAGKGSG